MTIQEEGEIELGEVVSIEKIKNTASSSSTNKNSEEDSATNPDATDGTETTKTASGSSSAVIMSLTPSPSPLDIDSQPPTVKSNATTTRGDESDDIKSGDLDTGAVSVPAQDEDTMTVAPYEQAYRWRISNKTLPIVSSRVCEWLERSVEFVMRTALRHQLDQTKCFELLVNENGGGCWHRLLLLFMCENAFEFCVYKSSHHLNSSSSNGSGNNRVVADKRRQSVDDDDLNSGLEIVVEGEEEKPKRRRMSNISQHSGKNEDTAGYDEVSSVSSRCSSVGCASCFESGSHPTELDVLKIKKLIADAVGYKLKVLEYEELKEIILFKEGKHRYENCKSFK